MTRDCGTARVSSGARLLCVTIYLTIPHTTLTSVRSVFASTPSIAWYPLSRARCVRAGVNVGGVRDRTTGLEWRLGVFTMYCAPWARQAENMAMGTLPEVLTRLLRPFLLFALAAAAYPAMTHTHAYYSTTYIHHHSYLRYIIVFENTKHATSCTQNDAT